MPSLRYAEPIARITVSAVNSARCERTTLTGEVRSTDVTSSLTSLSAEPLGLLAHLHHQRRTDECPRGNPVVLDVRGGHECATKLTAFEHQRAEVGSGRVERPRRIQRGRNR